VKGGEYGLPTLDESHLNELLGIGAGTTDITVYSDAVNHSAWFGPASGPKRIVHERLPHQPQVDSIAPNAGPATGGTSVTIYGGNLKRVTQVLFGRAGGGNVQDRE
jgi:hypothetical protein